MCSARSIARAGPADGARNFITGVSLSFNVEVPQRDYKKLIKSREGAKEAGELPCEALDSKTIWQVAEKVDHLTRKIWAAHRHRWVHTGLHELLQAAKLPPPPVFLHCGGVVMGNGDLTLRRIPRELKPAALGKPIIPYTTALGAMVTARALGMVDNRDLSDFAVLVS